MPRVALCYGTRPQVIKASVLRTAFAMDHEVRAIDTGQHYDYELNALLYEQLGVLPPDVLLEVGSGEHATQFAAVLTRAAEAFKQDRPDVVVVIGDTNSTLGCALAAVQLRIPVIHVEAGLRAADALMAEEINRRAVDAVASTLCTPSARATERVRRERVDALVLETGDVARDVLVSNQSRSGPIGSIEGWPLSSGEPFVFSTVHRAELTSTPDRLAAVVDALGRLPHRVVLAAHPRTRAVLDANEIAVDSDRVKIVPPLGYLETIACVSEATAVVSDSGGVQREAYWLGTPCLTLRSETEWEETLELGANTLCSPDALGELPRLFSQAAGGSRDWNRDAYGDGQAARRINDAVAATLEVDQTAVAGR